MISLGSLTLELPGFVEVIEYSLYAWLSNRGYPSLYRFYDLITEAWVYGILFGPLALVNTAVGITFGFTHLNLDGTDSCWRITYRFGEVFEDLGDGVSTVYRQHRLSIEDVDEIYTLSLAYDEVNLIIHIFIKKIFFLSIRKFWEIESFHLIRKSQTQT